MLSRPSGNESKKENGHPKLGRGLTFWRLRTTSACRQLPIGGSGRVFGTTKMVCGGTAPANVLDPETMAQAEAQKAINKSINKMIRSSRESAESKTKMLLLGAGESGKSTIFKQMQIINGTGYTKDELASFKWIIHRNVLDAIQILITQVCGWCDAMARVRWHESVVRPSTRRPRRWASSSKRPTRVSSSPPASSTFPPSLCCVSLLPFARRRRHTAPSLTATTLAPPPSHAASPACKDRAEQVQLWEGENLNPELALAIEALWADPGTEPRCGRLWQTLRMSRRRSGVPLLCGHCDLRASRDDMATSSCSRCEVFVFTALSLPHLQASSRPSTSVPTSSSEMRPSTFWTRSAGSPRPTTCRSSTTCYARACARAG